MNGLVVMIRCRSWAVGVDGPYHGVTKQWSSCYFVALTLDPAQRSPPPSPDPPLGWYDRDMPKTAAELDRDIRAVLKSNPGASHHAYRVELSEHGRPSLQFERDDYRTALQDAKNELLGAGGDFARIYLRNALVAEGRLQRRTMKDGSQKFSVLFVGEKPATRP